MRSARLGQAGGRSSPRRRPIHARAAVHRPLFTGTLAIDAMFPIGRGQRELILGDGGTGRTSLALTAMLRQRTTDVRKTALRHIEDAAAAEEDG